MTYGTTRDGWDYVTEAVKDHTEEQPCGRCGQPLHTGQTVVWVELGDVYCGLTCLERVHGTDIDITEYNYF